MPDATFHHLNGVKVWLENISCVARDEIEYLNYEDRDLFNTSSCCSRTKEGMANLTPIVERILGRLNKVLGKSMKSSTSAPSDFDHISKALIEVIARSLSA
ncbi:hypothetical protein MMC18_002417 [Xylographa bjoerkii]|nr:hypothetical protein [Xylographa bjoerkii]